MKKALILVDIQNDFLPGGNLPVPNGDEVVPVANEIMWKFDLVVATYDSHPENHVSFASNHLGREVLDVVEIDGVQQILWPIHCVSFKHGWQHPDDLQFLDLEDEKRKGKQLRVIYKGTDSRVDAYSGFAGFGNNLDKENSTLEKILKELEIDEVYIMGLATDYCVKSTALDSAKLGFKTFVIEDGCRGVEANPGDVEKAIEEMKDAEIEIINSKDI